MCNQPERRTITIETIAYILEAIKSLSAQLFLFSTTVEPLVLLKDVPDEINQTINDPEFSELIDSCMLPPGISMNIFLPDRS